MPPKINTKVIANLENLCRICCTKEEEKELLASLNQILEYINQLDEIDTSDTLPCNNVLQDMIGSVFREDEIGDPMNRDAFLANAPDQIGGMIRIPVVMKEL